MSYIFENFDTARAYIYNVLVIIKSDFADHLKYLDKVLQKLVGSGLNVGTKEYSPYAHKLSNSSYELVSMEYSPYHLKYNPLITLMPQPNYVMYAGS